MPGVDHAPGREAPVELAPGAETIVDAPELPARSAAEVAPPGAARVGFVQGTTGKEPEKAPRYAPSFPRWILTARAIASCHDSPWPRLKRRRRAAASSSGTRS